MVLHSPFPVFIFGGLLVNLPPYFPASRAILGRSEAIFEA
mgnify:CR=1 FL=1